jgi:hypothetical protein
VRLGKIPGSPRPISFVSLGWEVVQSVVHQPLELTILVRVQASQPNNSLNRRHLTVQNPFLFWATTWATLVQAWTRLLKTEHESTTKKALEATLPGPFNLTVARQKKQEGDHYGNGAVLRSGFGPACSETWLLSTHATIQLESAHKCPRKLAGMSQKSASACPSLDTKCGKRPQNEVVMTL